MKLFFSRRATQDLEDIANYIALDDPDHAARFVADLRQACAGLCDFPYRFPQARRYGKAFIRQRVFRDYLIIYAIVDDGVTVVTIGHGSREV